MREYQEQLKQKMKAFAHQCFIVVKKFPSDERYEASSQLRRASMSVMLNYVEGYARRKPLVRLNFLEIAYGSCRESQCLLEFAAEEKWIVPDDVVRLDKQCDEIAAMLWTEIKHLDNG